MTTETTPDLSRAPRPPVRLTLRSPTDVLAAVPVILGFQPEESLVMLTFGGAEAFHARTDLPPAHDLADLGAVVDLLLQPARAHGVTGAVLVVYTADQGWAETVELTAAGALQAAGITVLASVRTDGSRWWAPGSVGDDGRPAGGTRYTSSAHRFRAEAVVRGEVVHGSRAELAALLDSTPAGVARVRASRRHARAADAWLAGHGALAWCAVDRCRRFDPGHTLARLVQDLLVAAVPPSAWEVLAAGSGEVPTL